jgi:hypothetical protein
MNMKGRFMSPASSPWLRAVPLITAVLLVACVGCKSDPHRLHLTTYNEAGEPQRRYTDLSQAYYHRNHDGRVEIVLVAETPDSQDPTQTVTQLMHIKELWTPHPGVTFANATQINARIHYVIMTETSGIRYDGAAFVTYDISDRTRLLEGEIEAGQMIAKTRMGQALEPFANARIDGKLTALPDSGRVVEALQTVEHRFPKLLYDK